MVMAAEVHRVLVTGGAGNVGRIVVKHLVQAGYDIRVLDLQIPDERIGEFIYGNTGDAATVCNALDGCDAVIHLGEASNVMHGRPRNETFAVNAQITSTVSQLACSLRVKRIVYASSCQVYGVWGIYDGSRLPSVYPTRLPFDETEPVKPFNAYAASKVANEHYLEMLCRRDEVLRASVFRLPATIGAEHIGHHARRWWSSASVDHFGEGYYTYLISEDAARAFELALKCEQPGYEVYHLVAKNVYGTIPLRDRIARHYAAGPQLPADWPDLLAPVDCSKAHRHLGWEPTYEVNV
jgi:UDP-glucose 4-epimerase